MLVTMMPVFVVVVKIVLLVQSMLLIFIFPNSF